MAPLMGQTSQLLCPRIQLVEGKRTKHELISWRMPIFMYIAAHHSVQSRKSNCHVLAGARLLAFSVTNARERSCPLHPDPSISASELELCRKIERAAREDRQPLLPNLKVLGHLVTFQRSMTSPE